MLTDKIITTVTLPSGDWVKVRKPGIGIKSEARNAEDGWRIYLIRCIKEWSYDAPIDDENIANLDDEDAVLVLNAILGVTTEEEAKAETKNA